tara:strand:- start:121 stop:429 length:309 start_codon:yes stop_codon:yes gene_type:complete
MIYKTITNTSEHDLVVRGNNLNMFGGRVGGVSKITITNVHATVEPVVRVFLEDAAGVEFDIAKALIPVNTTLVVDDNVSFNGAIYSLKIQASITGELDIIVK